MNVVPAHQTYTDQMASLGNGVAIWQPAPHPSHGTVQIGVVGYMQGGHFLPLFHAGLPPGNRKPDKDVPDDFIQLNVGEIAHGQPRKPGCLHTKSIKRKNAKLDVAAESPLSPFSALAELEFESFESAGALLLTKDRTYVEDATRLLRFKNYILKNSRAWVMFARNLGHDVNEEDIMLVTGCDMTEGFSMVAFRETERQFSLRFKGNAHGVVGFGVSAFGSWSCDSPIFENWGPQRTTPNSSYSQCVFAGAGPADLGSGGREDPELLLQRSRTSEEEQGSNDDSYEAKHSVRSKCDAERAIVHDMEYACLLRLWCSRYPEEPDTDAMDMLGKLRIEVTQDDDGAACVVVPSVSRESDAEQEQITEEGSVSEKEPDPDRSHIHNWRDSSMISPPYIVSPTEPDHHRAHSTVSAATSASISANAPAAVPAAYTASVGGTPSAMNISRIPWNPPLGYKTFATAPPSHQPATIPSSKILLVPLPRSSEPGISVPFPMIPPPPRRTIPSPPPLPFAEPGVPLPTPVLFPLPGLSSPTRRMTALRSDLADDSSSSTPELSSTDSDNVSEILESPAFRITGATAIPVPPPERKGLSGAEHGPASTHTYTESLPSSLGRRQPADRSFRDLVSQFAYSSPPEHHPMDSEEPRELLPRGASGETQIMRQWLS
ncbi:hypothetical protein EIP91_008408 [Steccherinum ochraceum]|uniref:Uncharacterized protein n=1 Tax=Steccherinum ochraceum TaxID=92696 RepID=A0A4R0R2W6_9APHY|nr:hypothetical protein EIP91_008408 [Steccherinum ochraceum]